MIDWDLFTLITGGIVMGSLALTDRIVKRSEAAKVGLLARLKRDRRVIVIRRGRTKATATKEAPPPPKPPLVIDWVDVYEGFVCPSCGLSLVRIPERGHKTCDCSECDVQHFHERCAVHDSDRGCEFEWIMRAKFASEQAEKEPQEEGK